MNNYIFFSYILGRMYKFIGDLDLITDEMIDPPALQGDGWIDHEFILLVNLFQKKVHVIDTTDKSLLLDSTK